MSDSGQTPARKRHRRRACGGRCGSQSWNFRGVMRKTNSLLFSQKAKKPLSCLPSPLFLLSCVGVSTCAGKDPSPCPRRPWSDHWRPCLQCLVSAWPSLVSAWSVLACPRKNGLTLEPPAWPLHPLPKFRISVEASGLCRPASLLFCFFLFLPPVLNSNLVCSWHP